jgi:beta-carotene 3-hydroxylase
VYAALSAGLVIWGDLKGHWLFWVGIGIMVYGLLYFLLHDVIVHQRVRFRYRFRHPYLLRIIRAHKIHHKHLGRAGSQAFGFLYAAPRFAPRRQPRVDQ